MICRLIAFAMPLVVVMTWPILLAAQSQSESILADPEVGQSTFSKIPSGTYVRLSSLIPHGPFAATSQAAPLNIFINAKGQEITGPPIDGGKPPPKSAYPRVGAATIDPETSTGPYRRVFSTPGHSYVLAHVYLPCRAAHLFGDSVDHDVETGFVYAGGWGAGAYGVAVDAGLMKSSWQDGSTLDAYSLFILYKGMMLVKQHPNDPDLPRFQCNTSVKITFSPEAGNRLGITANGTDVGGLTRKEHLYVDVAANDGWSINSAGSSETGAIVKRMTTIGQPDRPRSSPPTTFDNYIAALKATWDTDGSYFGTDVSESEPKVRWQGVFIGSITAGHLTSRPWNSGDTYGCHNVPNRAKVLIHYVDAANEDDAIILGNKPGSGDKLSCR